MYHTTGFDRDEIIDLCVLITSAERDPDFQKWPPVLGLYKSVIVTLAYLRHNRTQAELGETHGVSQPTISRAIQVITPLIAEDLARYVPTADDLDTRTQYIVDGTLLPCWSWATHPELYSGKHRTTGSGSRFSLGDGGPATAAELLTPTGVAPGAAVRMAIAETDCRVRVVASQTGTFFGQPMTAGHIYTAAGTGYCGYSGDGGPATAAELNDPQGVAFDHAGNLLIADTQNNAVRVVAAKTGRFYGQAMTAGDIYSLPVSAQPCCPLWHPMGVAVDKAGNVLVADTGWNVVMVRAARTRTFYGQPMTAGHAYLVAGNYLGGPAGSGDGGPATSAVLVSPQGVAADKAGNLVIADTMDNRIRVVADRSGTFYGQAMTAGDIYTVAGDGILGYGGDGGPATAAELFRPDGVTADGSGNLVTADTGNNRVRMVAASTGDFYGQATTPGDIYTVAGNGTAGFSGDGGPAATAQVSHPQDVTVNASGDLLIADTYTNRIRKVAG